MDKIVIRRNFLSTLRDVGIGTTEPAHTLDVSGNLRVTSSTAGSYSIITNQNTAPCGRIWNWLSSSTGTGLGPDAMCFEAGGACRFSVGLTGITTGDITISGTPYRAGGDVAWQIPSDKRLKDVSGAYEHSLSDLAQIDVVRFHYKKENPAGADTSKEYIGVLAQDVQKVIPEAVSEDPKTGFLSLNTTPIFWAMLNAVKDLYSRILGVEAEQAVQGRQIASKTDKAETEALRAEVKAKDQKIKELERRLKQQEAETKARFDKIEKMLKAK